MACRTNNYYPINSPNQKIIQYSIYQDNNLTSPIHTDEKLRSRSIQNNQKYTIQKSQHHSLKKLDCYQNGAFQSQFSQDSSSKQTLTTNPNESQNNNKEGQPQIVVSDLIKENQMLRDEIMLLHNLINQVVPVISKITEESTSNMQESPLKTDSMQSPQVKTSKIQVLKERLQQDYQQQKIPSQNEQYNNQQKFQCKDKFSVSPSIMNDSCNLSLKFNDRESLRGPVYESKTKEHFSGLNKIFVSPKQVIKPQASMERMQYLLAKINANQELIQSHLETPPNDQQRLLLDSRNFTCTNNSKQVSYFIETPVVNFSRNMQDNKDLANSGFISNESMISEDESAIPIDTIKKQNILNQNFLDIQDIKTTTPFERFTINNDQGLLKTTESDNKNDKSFVPQKIQMVYPKQFFKESSKNFLESLGSINSLQSSQKSFLQSQKNQQIKSLTEDKDTSNPEESEQQVQNEYSKSLQEQEIQNQIDSQLKDLKIMNKYSQHIKDVAMFDLRTPKTESEFLIEDVMADLNMGTNEENNIKGSHHNRFISFRGSIGQLVQLLNKNEESDQYRDKSISNNHNNPQTSTENTVWQQVVVLSSDSSSKCQSKQTTQREESNRTSKQLKILSQFNKENNPSQDSLKKDGNYQLQQQNLDDSIPLQEFLCIKQAEKPQLQLEQLSSFKDLHQISNINVHQIQIIEELQTNKNQSTSKKKNFKKQKLKDFISSANYFSNNKDQQEFHENQETNQKWFSIQEKAQGLIKLNQEILQQSIENLQESCEESKANRANDMHNSKNMPVEAFKIDITSMNSQDGLISDRNILLTENIESYRQQAAIIDKKFDGKQSCNETQDDEFLNKYFMQSQNSNNNQPLLFSPNKLNQSPTKTKIESSQKSKYTRLVESVKKVRKLYDQEESKDGSLIKKVNNSNDKKQLSAILNDSSCNKTDTLTILDITKQQDQVYLLDRKTGERLKTILEEGPQPLTEQQYKMTSQQTEEDLCTFDREYSNNKTQRVMDTFVKDYLNVQSSNFGGAKTPSFDSRTPSQMIALAAKSPSDGYDEKSSQEQIIVTAMDYFKNQEMDELNRIIQQNLQECYEQELSQKENQTQDNPLSIKFNNQNLLESAIEELPSVEDQESTAQISKHGRQSIIKIQNAQQQTVQTTNESNYDMKESEMFNNCKQILKTLAANRNGPTEKYNKNQNQSSNSVQKYQESNQQQQNSQKQRYITPIKSLKNPAPNQGTPKQQQQSQQKQKSSGQHQSKIQSYKLKMPVKYQSTTSQQQQQQLLVQNINSMLMLSPKNRNHYNSLLQQSNSQNKTIEARTQSLSSSRKLQGVDSDQLLEKEEQRQQIVQHKIQRLQQRLNMNYINVQQDTQQKMNNSNVSSIDSQSQFLQSFNKTVNQRSRLQSQKVMISANSTKDLPNNKPPNQREFSAHSQKRSKQLEEKAQELKEKVRQKEERIQQMNSKRKEYERQRNLKRQVREQINSIGGGFYTKREQLVALSNCNSNQALNKTPMRRESNNLIEQKSISRKERGNSQTKIPTNQSQIENHQNDNNNNKQYFTKPQSLQKQQQQIKFKIQPVSITPTYTNRQDNRNKSNSICNQNKNYLSPTGPYYTHDNGE